MLSKLDSNEKSWKEKIEDTEQKVEKIWKEKLDRAVNEGIAAQKDLKHQLELEKINTAKVQAKLDQTLLKDNTSELEKVNEELAFENEQLRKKIASLEALEKRFQSEEERYVPILIFFFAFIKFLKYNLFISMRSMFLLKEVFTFFVFRNF